MYAGDTPRDDLALSVAEYSCNITTQQFLGLGHLDQSQYVNFETCSDRDLWCQLWSGPKWENWLIYFFIFVLGFIMMMVGISCFAYGYAVIKEDRALHKLAAQTADIDKINEEKQLDQIRQAVRDVRDESTETYEKRKREIEEAKDKGKGKE